MSYKYKVPDDRLIQEATLTIEKLHGTPKHKELARNHIHLLTTDMTKLVQYYDDLRQHEPSTYVDNVTSGKMARDFKIVFHADEDSMLDLITITKHWKSKLLLERAIAACGGNSELTPEELDSMSMNMMRSLIKDNISPAIVKRKAIARAKELLEYDERDDEQIEAEVDLQLTNYLR